MKALILNSGTGTRMGTITDNQPKCLTDLRGSETILSRQLEYLNDCGIRNIVITTGHQKDILEEYCRKHFPGMDFAFAYNDLYKSTNYIYSIYLARQYLNDDILMIHGDLVFEKEVLEKVLSSTVSCMTVSSTLPLPPKDFKAVVYDGYITAVGVEFFNEACYAQPLYKLLKEDWLKWLEQIEIFINRGDCRDYAENALNELNGACKIVPLDMKNMLCAEIDNLEDLEYVRNRLAER